MRKLLAVFAAAALAGGAWQASNNFQLDGLDRLRLVPRGAEPAANDEDEATEPANLGREVVRIASFNVQEFDESKADRPSVMQHLARIVQQFDVVALQEVQAQHRDVMAELVAAANAAGRQYAYVLSPRLGRAGPPEQFAYLFDTARVELDRSELYVVNDPHDLLHREPFVAWFRARGPAPDAAFTFTLVNVRVDPVLAEQELDVLADVFAKVRHDGRGEDDVILLGDLQSDDRWLGRLQDLPNVAWAISGLPTNTRGNAQYDNLIFNTQATNEFTGAIGVYDFLRELNLSLDEALEISDHLPVWAEFSVYEGGRRGRVATLPSERRP